MPSLKQIIAISALGVALILGLAAYTVFKTPAAASGPIAAIPLTESQSSPSATAIANATAADTQPTAADATSDASALAADSVVFQIVPAESEARFIIDEVLDNQPKTVVGTTDQVAGEIALDPQNPTQTRVGTIQINARTLTTDSEFRNRAIKNQILQTDQYEFITFTPTAITGLPQSGAVGEPYTFQIAGDLTIGDVTRPVTFDVTTSAATESRLEGTATTTIAYADYGISIPQVRQVASVAEQVRLELDFVAVTA
jgi:polyisoprenoid-binding protein YceI